MTHRVTLQPSGHVFENPPGESLLDSALSSGLAVAYGCSNGNCGKCRARRVDGEVRRLKHSDFAFSAADASAGWFLLCCHAAASALVLDTGVARDPRDIERQEIEVKVKRVVPLDARWSQAHVQTPRTRRLRFLAGQWARLTRGDRHVELPIASCPCDDRNLQFHVAVDGEDAALFEPGATLALSGPLGEFVLDADSTRPRLMVGADAGMAPLASIIEHSQSLDESIAVSLLLIGDAGHAHYLDNQLRSWRDALDSFDYVRAARDSLAEGIRQLPGATAPGEADWYVAGPAALVDATVAELSGMNVPPHRVRRQEI